MSAPVNQVLNTIELLEQILWDLPLNELLRVRQVSRTWREVAMRSKQVKDVQETPYINLRFHPPLFRTLSANNSIKTKVEVELILWQDKPMTFGLFGGCDISPRCPFYKFEEQAGADWTGRRYICGREYDEYVDLGARSRYFFRDPATLYPGIPFRTHWSMHLCISKYWPATSRDPVFQVYADTTYVFKLRPGISTRGVVEVKEQLLERMAQGDVISCEEEKRLSLVGENEFRFTAIP